MQIVIKNFRFLPTVPSARSISSFSPSRPVVTRHGGPHVQGTDHTGGAGLIGLQLSGAARLRRSSRPLVT
jgi:hypothetical protein